MTIPMVVRDHRERVIVVRTPPERETNGECDDHEESDREGTDYARTRRSSGCMSGEAAGYAIVSCILVVGFVVVGVLLFVDTDGWGWPSYAYLPPASRGDYVFSFLIWMVLVVGIVIICVVSVGTEAMNSSSSNSTEMSVRYENPRATRARRLKFSRRRTSPSSSSHAHGQATVVVIKQNTGFQNSGEGAAPLRSSDVNHPAQLLHWSMV